MLPICFIDMNYNKNQQKTKVKKKKKLAPFLLRRRC